MAGVHSNLEQRPVGQHESRVDLVVRIPDEFSILAHIADLFLCITVRVIMDNRVTQIHCRPMLRHGLRHGAAMKNQRGESVGLEEVWVGKCR